MQIVNQFSNFIEMSISFVLGVLDAFVVSELFRKVREGAGIHFHRVSSKSEPGRRSYDPKTKKVNEYKINEY